MIEIDSGIPLPVRIRNGGRGGHHKYPWYVMKRGDSFFMPASHARVIYTRSSILNSAKSYAKRNKLAMTFTTRATLEGKRQGVRIWRVK